MIGDSREEVYPRGHLAGFGCVRTAPSRGWRLTSSCFAAPGGASGITGALLAAHAIGPTGRRVVGGYRAASWPWNWAPTTPLWDGSPYVARLPGPSCSRNLEREHRRSAVPRWTGAVGVGSVATRRLDPSHLDVLDEVAQRVAGDAVQGGHGPALPVGDMMSVRCDPTERDARHGRGRACRACSCGRRRRVADRAPRCRRCRS